MERGEAYVEPWQILVAERGNQVAEDGNGKEHEEDLVGLASKDTVALFVLEDVDAADKEQSGTKVDGQSNSDVSDDVEPTADPASDTTILGG